MIITSITSDNEIWESVANYAEQCTWSVGKNLARAMRANSFNEWERVFVALEGDCILGYCTFCETDCIPDVPYTPYIGYLFVGEAFRGNRLSQKLIVFVMEYARKLGFGKVYLVSDHINLYEKYGFIKVDQKPAPWNSNTMETIYMYTL